MAIKRLPLAKGRISELAPRHRAALALEMARHTLSTLSRVEELAGSLVVTSDEDAAALATGLGHHVVADGGEGLNVAIECGMSAAFARGATHILVLHADFLQIEAREIGAMLSHHEREAQRDVGLLRCRHGSGTNAALFAAGSAFRPMFGPDSFSRHWQAAGARAYELTAASLARDIDTLADLDAARAAGAVSAAVERIMAEHEQARTAGLLAEARTLRDAGFGDMITYSPKIFIPLTQLCRDACHYCTFAKTPKRASAPYMTIEQVLDLASAGAAVGCKEALFTLGERPERRYGAARDWLDANGFASTLDYVAHAARTVRDRTGLLPHINAGCMTPDEMASLRPVGASMGLMLESVSERLCARGGPHFGSPDKQPAARLASIEEAGKQHIPFTTGILIGIGETRSERLESLAAIHALHQRHGHVQEIIIQNFMPKPGTKMAEVPPAPIEELVWTIAQARVMFGPHMSIQAPPNLNAGKLGALIEAGINDWGGVSPLTPDHVNPEAPWPEIARLSAETAASGKRLAPRLTIYPDYIRDAERWIAPEMRRHVFEHADSGMLAREDDWRTGRSKHVPPAYLERIVSTRPSWIKSTIREICDYGAEDLSTADTARLFTARGSDFHAICAVADEMRATVNGNRATYVVNRNVNYTNICTYKCNFCAFSKGTRRHEGAERPYLLDSAEIGRRVIEARERGASEVCLQGGIHPRFTGETYLEIVRCVKAAVPDMHVHAFSPLEIAHGARTLGMPLDSYLAQLRRAGLGSLPGTAAEILHDPIRARICPDKLSTAEWLEVIETAHRVGIKTTSTIMFGHVDGYADWAIHLQLLRNLQMRTGGITEFVPLAFVAHEAPLYKRGQSRPGPTLREAILMHAVSRMVLYPWIPNIQASWVKMGRDGMRLALRSGANDLGGTLMDESITRAAGADHGQEMTPAEMSAMASSLGRVLTRRTTLYARADEAALANEET